ncbi:MAG: winged helix-turn-helix domain-containing protein [Acidobacteriota bacterium]
MSKQDNHLYVFDRFCLDSERERLLRDGEPVPLPPKAMELLQLLLERPGKILEKDFLMTSLWGKTIVEEANLTQSIYLLRKALGKTTDGQVFIETHAKLGYRFVPAVQTLCPPDSPPENTLVVSKVTRSHIVIAEEEIEEEPDSQLERGRFVRAVERLADSQALTELQARTERPRSRRWAAVALAVVILAGIGFWRLRGGAPADGASLKSIAVLPFKTIGEEGNEGFLGLGMADAIITRLGRTGKIAVSPTEAIRRYGEKGVDALTAGRGLDVAAVLTGNVQQSGERIRVTVQLLRVSNGQPLWADQFDERRTDIFTVQDSIAQRLAGALTLKLSGDEQKRLTQTATSNVEAYQLYLQGRYYWAKRTPEWIRKAIACFEQAARLDPNYAHAYAGLADSYALTASGLPPLERVPKAKAAAQRALALDESLAETHTSLAFILYKFEWNWLESENHFRRALQLNPTYSIAQHWFGESLVLMGRYDEGLARLREAERLDPLSMPIKADIGRALYRARRYDEAIARSRQLLEMDPNFRNAYSTIMYACQQKGLFAEAVDADLQVLRLSNVQAARIEDLKAAFASSGWQGYWRKQLELMQERARSEYVPAYVFAEIHLRLGDREAALQAIEKSYEERGDGPLFVRAEPPLDALRSDPRFAYFLRRSGLGNE